MDQEREYYAPRDMDELRQIIGRSRGALEQAIAGRDEAELSEKRDAGGWSVKDHLVHVAAWERSMVALLGRRPRHEGLGVDASSYRNLDVDAVNALIFTRHQNLPLSEVLAMFHAAHDEMTRTLAACSWDDLRRPYSYYLPDEPGEDRGEPVLNWVLGNTAGHFDEHRIWIEELLASR